MTTEQIDEKILDLTWRRVAIYQNVIGSNDGKYESWRKIQDEIEKLERQKNQPVLSLVVPNE